MVPLIRVDVRISADVITGISLGVVFREIIEVRNRAVQCAQVFFILVGLTGIVWFPFLLYGIDSLTLMHRRVLNHNPEPALTAESPR